MPQLIDEINKDIKCEPASAFSRNLTLPIPPFPFHNGKYPLYIPNVPLTHIYCTGTDTVILYNMSMCTGVDLCEPIYFSEDYRQLIERPWLLMADGKNTDV